MRVFRRILCFALGVGVAVVLTAAHARAQSGEGELLVTVVAESGGGPLEDAEVFLVGPQQTSELTGRAGILRFTGVPAGIYRIKVQRKGYLPADLTDFEVPEGRRVALTVRLAAELRVIGTVVARSSASITVQDINEGSAVRRVSDTLADALDKLAGVALNQSSNGPDSVVTISLHNHDAAQTSTLINGVHLSPSATRAIGTDLFSGASIDFGASDASALGGSVNYRTIEPTKTWQYKVTSGYGTYDKSSYQVMTTGSFGKLGLATHHAFRGSNSPLTDKVYQDSSGLSYAHGGENHQLADFFKLRYSLDKKTTINATALYGNREGLSLCARFTQSLPCGWGPGINDYDHYAQRFVGLQRQVGNVVVNAALYDWTGYFVWDASGRYFAGAPAPSVAQWAYSGYGESVALNTTYRRHTAFLTLYRYASFNSFANALPIAFVGPVAARSGVSSVVLGDAFKASSKLTWRSNLSLASSDASPGALVGTIGANWKPTAFNTFDGSVSVGSAQPYQTQATPFTDTRSVNFACNGGFTRIEGPADAPTPQSSLSYNLSWQHQWRLGNATLSIFDQRQSGQAFSAFVPIEAEPAAYLPPGYVDALRAAWSAPAACGGRPFDATRIYVASQIAGTTRRYRGFDLSGRIGIGRAAVLFPTYSTNLAQLTSYDARLVDPYSFTIAGAQLPMKPAHRAGLTLDVLQAKSGFEWLLNAQYTSSNNGRGLPAFTQFNAGLSRALTRGRLTVIISNLFNTDAGVFATQSGAASLPLFGGGSLSDTATPLSPRQFTVQYTVTGGKK